MGGAVPTIFWFDRFDDRIGILPVAGELVHTEELNGEDTLEFQSYEVPAKGDRLLWLDGGVWREHVVGFSRIRENTTYADQSVIADFSDPAGQTPIKARKVGISALACVCVPTTNDVRRTYGTQCYRMG